MPTFWDPFAVFLERPELLIDERFATNEKRMLNRDALHEIIADTIAPLPKAVIDERATSCRIPVGVVQSFADVLGDTHLAGREVWQEINSSKRDAVLSPRPSWRVHGDVPTSFTLTEPESAGAEFG